MNTQQRMVESRTFRIAAIAVAAAGLLALAAYLFGTGLRADTSASVAPSPLGSSLTDSRQSVAFALVAVAESRLEDFYGRWSASSAAARAAAPAAVGESRLEDFYGRWAASSEAATLASLSAISTRRPSFLADPNISGAPAAADPYQNEWMGFTSPESVGARSAVVNPFQTMGFASPESVGASSSAADPYQNEWMGFTSPESVGARSAAVNPYQRMGFAAPESVGARLPSVADAGVSGFPSIKPEGIRASGGAGEYSWIKPEGIETSGAK